jgi:predicted metal-dependent hydrolase
MTTLAQSLNWCGTSMSTETRRIVVSGINVDVVRKPIKNLHLGVYPPAGRVRVAAPPAVSDDAVRLAVIGKLGWIRRQRAKYAAQPRQSEREMVSGESHYFLGQRYRLRVIPDDGAARVTVRNRGTLELRIRPETDAAARERVLHRWYRERLRELSAPLVAKWQTILGVEAAQVRIKKMKTKWGSCNVSPRRIWLNLELAKKPALCLEYVVVHELVHLIERNHTDRFVSLLDKHLPNWRQHRQALNDGPLAHDGWNY